MARVSEAVNSGEDLVLEDGDQEDNRDKQNNEDNDEEEEEKEEEMDNSGRDINILSSRLDKTEQSLDSLGSHQSLLSDLLCSLL